MLFFGTNERVVQYAGQRPDPDNKNYVGSLMFRTKAQIRRENIEHRRMILEKSGKFTPEEINNELGICNVCHNDVARHDSMCPNNIANSDAYQYRESQM